MGTGVWGGQGLRSKDWRSGATVKKQAKGLYPVLSDENSLD